MDMHIALPENLEKLVRAKIESGQYQSESELVCAALRLYLHQPTEGEVLDEVVLPRLEALKNGTLETSPWDSGTARHWEREEIEKIESE